MISVWRKLIAAFFLMSCVISAEFFFQWLLTLDFIGGIGDIWYVINNITGLGCNSSEGLAVSD